MSPRRINQVTAILLALGLGCAVVIYFTAKPVVVDPFGNPLHSKKYVHELRVMGGKANVAYAEFEAWLASLWEGRSLAGTVAVLSVAATLLFRFVASHPELYTPEPPPHPRNGSDEVDSGKTS